MNRRWQLIAGVVLTVAVALGVVAWQRSDDSSSSNETTSTETTSSETTAPFGVERRDVTFVDPSRPTAELPDAGIAARPDRTLPTVVLYPTGDGPFPLVVFSHGVGSNPDAYVDLVEPLAEAGYVVALPAFPLSSQSGEAVFDVLNQPADVSFVIDQMLTWPEVDGERIAAAGHSLGAVTTVGLTYDTCCRDERIDAAVAIAGVGVPSGPGSLDNRPPVPLLLVHGDADDVVPVSGSDTLFADATGPAYYLRLFDADHISFAFGEDGQLTGEAVGAFLAAELKDEPAALAAMPEVVERSGQGEWQTRNT